MEKTRNYPTTFPSLQPFNQQFLPSIYRVNKSVLFRKDSGRKQMGHIKLIDKTTQPMKRFANHENFSSCPSKLLHISTQKRSCASKHGRPVSKSKQCI